MLLATLVAATLVAWAITLCVVLPKLREFKTTTGVYDKLHACEGNTLQRARLHLHGAKVAIGGFITSSIPVIGMTVDSLNNVKWEAIFPTAQAERIGAILAFLVSIGPLVFIVAHMVGIADAAKCEPCHPATE